MYHPNTALVDMGMIWRLASPNMEVREKNYGSTYDKRKSRMQGHGHIPNVYMKSTDKFPSGRDFKTFLCSSGNKIRLQALNKSQLSIK